MIVREIRWGLFSRGTWMVRAFYGTFVLFIFPMLGACMSNYTRSRVSVMTVQMVMLIFAAPVLAGSAWTKEREQGNFDMIRMTLLRATQLYLGKAAGGMVALAPVVAALFLVTLPAFVWHGHEYAVLVCGCLTLLNCACIALAISLYASIVCRRTTTAIAWGIVLCSIFFFGFYAAGLFLDGSSFDLFTGESPYDTIRMLSPITSYLETFGASVRSTYWQGVPWDRYYGWAQSQIVFTCMAGGFLAMSIYRLTRREMRDP